MDDCIFCKIVAGDIPADIVYQDDMVTAFNDINPQTPTHILVIPNKHIASVQALNDDDAAHIAALMLVVPQIAAEAGVAESGYRLSTNTGDDGRQSVYHLHLHLLGGRRLSGKMG